MSGDRRLHLTRVTPAHGERFATAWFQQSEDSGGIWIACDETDLMTWPEESRIAQGRYQVMQDDICDLVFSDTRATVVEAFIRAATVVLRRERRRRSRAAVIVFYREHWRSRDE